MRGVCDRAVRRPAMNALDVVAPAIDALDVVGTVIDARDVAASVADSLVVVGPAVVTLEVVGATVVVMLGLLRKSEARRVTELDIRFITNGLGELSSDWSCSTT